MISFMIYSKRQFQRKLLRSGQSSLTHSKQESLQEKALAVIKQDIQNNQTSSEKTMLALELRLERAAIESKARITAHILASEVNQTRRQRSNNNVLLVKFTAGVFVLASASFAAIAYGFTYFGFEVVNHSFKAK
jgi:hypothetical protein